MYVVLRDDNGVPILTPEGFVQPLDANGNPLPLDEEGHPLDESLTVEVELGRLNVSRAPNQVLQQRLAEVVAAINSATAMTTDAAGRLVLTVDGEETTIDSPLENLAVYFALVESGSISGITKSPGDLGAFAYLADGQYTAEDLTAAASFLAAAGDKTQPVGVDTVVYLNSILGVTNGSLGADGRTYVDYSTYAYDRAATYGGIMVDLLVEQPDGSWVTETLNIMDAVFGGAGTGAQQGAAAYALAVDDARAVVNFLHEFEEPSHDTH